MNEVRHQVETLANWIRRVRQLGSFPHLIVPAFVVDDQGRPVSLAKRLAILRQIPGLPRKVIETVARQEPDVIDFIDSLEPSIAPRPRASLTLVANRFMDSAAIESEMGVETRNSLKRKEITMSETEQKKSPPAYETPWYGRVSAVVWSRDGQHGPMYTLDLREHFRNAGGDWRSTRSISEDQIGNLASAAADAHQWIARTRRDDRQHRRPANTA